jgi:ABC-type dipeptide/oligopeptide/nickel transport system permease component
MLGYIGHCLLRLGVAVVGIVTVAFFLMRAIPGDPAEYMLGDFATKESVAALRVRLGLDQPVLEQYRLFLDHALTGNLGSSIVTGQPALEEVLSSLPSSAALALGGLGLAIVLGVPLGIASAVRQGTWIDTTVMVAALAGISFPAFWMGIAGILVFAYWIPLFPALGASGSTNGWTQLHHLALPSIVLGLSIAAYIARLTRSAMLEILSQDYIRVARAMGVPERRVVLILALRNALIPILAVIGVSFAWSFGNAILIEMVFSRPGLGSMLMKAIQARDYQLVQAGVLIIAAAVVVVNAVIDLLYGIIDPRLRTT